MKKKSLLTLFLPTLLLFIIVLRPQVKESKPFCLEAICSAKPFQDEWVCRSPSGDEEGQILEALEQPYRYLGSGGQCYAFVSRDDKYVIKFFKQKAFAIPAWIDRFPLPILIGWFKEKKMRKREEHRSKVFTAFKLSLEDLAQETGMLFAHLNRTADLNKTLPFSDAKGEFHLLHLDDLEFVIQKKAEMAFARIDSLMQSKDISKAHQAIAKLLELNVELYRKGYRNRDPNFRSNCGFIGDEAVLIDVGRMVYSEDVKKPNQMKRELQKALPRFQKYLAAEHPELLTFFDSCSQNIILETAVRDGKVMQGFDSESVPMGDTHSQEVKGSPIGTDSGSKDCVNLPSPTAVSRITPIEP